jgi:transcriptional/translational regulatory protein YebC/TACO1
MNPRLRLAIADANAVNTPNATIARAIKTGTGELDGGNVDEIPSKPVPRTSIALVTSLKYGVNLTCSRMFGRS